MNFVRGEREAVLARREFLQQLSLWEEDIKIPLPGENANDLDNDDDDDADADLDNDFDIFSGLLSK